MPSPTSLRLLVACPTCRSQFDASAKEQGSRFHCACGEVLTVPTPRPRDAAVVRCSACGAPREEGTPACRYCSSDYTLHEQDLHTLCPGCATRISDAARYCHSCALPIVPQGTAGTATDHVCPTCGGDRRLFSRALGGEQLSVSECHRCAGVWLGNEVFRLLEVRAREKEVDWSLGRSGGGAAVVLPSDPNRPLYRKCPICSKLMHRRNYGRRSGVIVDVCASHGIWFDQGELARILEWIRDGSLSRAEQMRRVEDEGLTRARREVMTAPEGPTPFPASRGLARFLGYVVEYLLG